MLFCCNIFAIFALAHNNIWNNNKTQETPEMKKTSVQQKTYYKHMHSLINSSENIKKKDNGKEKLTNINE